MCLNVFGANKCNDTAIFYNLSRSHDISGIWKENATIRIQLLKASVRVNLSIPAWNGVQGFPALEAGWWFQPTPNMLVKFESWVTKLESLRIFPGICFLYFITSVFLILSRHQWVSEKKNVLSSAVGYALFKIFKSDETTNRGLSRFCSGLPSHCSHCSPRSGRMRPDLFIYIYGHPQYIYIYII